MSYLHPAFDWREVARLALASRLLDELEEKELTPSGLVTYQFSARGHELGQLLISQLLTRPYDAASVYYRSRPFMLGSGFTLEEALTADMARRGSLSDGRDVGVVFNLPRRQRALVLPNAADVGSQYTPGAGWAQAIRYRQDVLGEDVQASIAVVFGGDGSVASNGFWSALTMAATLSLPLLLVIEDNDYAISVTGDHQTPGRNVAQNLAAFHNLQIWDGSGTNPAETAVLVETAVAFVRQNRRPGLLRLRVPRLSGHSSVDNQAYKSAAEREAEWARDPIPALQGVSGSRAAGRSGLGRFAAGGGNGRANRPSHRRSHAARRTIQRDPLRVIRTGLSTADWRIGKRGDCAAGGNGRVPTA